MDDFIVLNDDEPKRVVAKVRDSYIESEVPLEFARENYHFLGKIVRGNVTTHYFQTWDSDDGDDW